MHRDVCVKKQCNLYNELVLEELWILKLELYVAGDISLVVNPSAIVIKDGAFLLPPVLPGF